MCSGRCSAPRSFSSTTKRMRNEQPFSRVWRILHGPAKIFEGGVATDHRTPVDRNNASPLLGADHYPQLHAAFGPIDRPCAPICTSDGTQFSFSLREKAGMRGKEAHECQSRLQFFLRPATLRISAALLVAFMSAVFPLSSAETNAPANFMDVQALFDKHCTECHESKDPEGKLVLESFESLMQGGETGPAIVPKKSADSLLVKM